MCKLICLTDMSIYNLEEGKEYLILHESDDYYYVQVNSKVVEMIAKINEGIEYEVCK